jgi:hypothetical protein
MQLLTAVNLILPALGEHPVTSLDIKHPTLAVILPQIEQQRQDFQTNGWWFNTVPARMLPNSEGQIDVPTGTLEFIPDSGDVASRGEMFYNIAERSYVFTEALVGDLIQDVPFEQLPESAAQYVLYSSLVLAYATDIGLEQTVQLWSAKANEALARVERAHLRNRKYSNTRSRRWRRYRQSLRG